MRIVPAGRAALLVETGTPVELAEALRRARDDGRLHCAEIVPGAATVLLDGVPDPRAAADAIRAADITAAPAAAAAAVEIPVRWDGADLADVAHRWGEDPPRVLRRTPFRVAFCGFAPGFGYLTGLPARLHLPRLTTPRTRVPAGSVAVAGPYTGVYPRPSPGGWRLLGRTDVILFDPGRDPPALLAPGTQVRFVDA